MYVTKQHAGSISSPRDRPENEAGRYRGYALPDGMTPECLDELAALMNRHARGESDDLDAEVAIKAFEIVSKHQTQTQPRGIRDMDGGPAFPTPRNEFGEYSESMSLRDYFAAAALTGLIASNDAGAGDRIEDVPRYAFDIADAMLKVRSRDGEGG